MSEQTIELDCAPGDPRPGDLIAGVVKGTILEGSAAADPENTVSRLFGNWLWNFPNVSPEEWTKVQTVTQPRIEALFKAGVIRFGSW